MTTTYFALPRLRSHYTLLLRSHKRRRVHLGYPSFYGVPFLNPYRLTVVLIKSQLAYVAIGRPSGALTRKKQVGATVIRERLGILEFWKLLEYKKIRDPCGKYDSNIVILDWDA